MNIKSAAKAVNQELKKVKDAVSEWHVKREEVFSDLKTSWQAQYTKSVDELKGSTIAKDVVIGLKEFEKFTNKQISSNVKKLIEINAEYSVKTKELSKGLGELAAPYLKTVKSASFGTGVKAVSAIEEDLTQWIHNECFKEFDAQSLVDKLGKKLSAATKDLTKQAGSEAEHLKYMAKVELFETTLLNSMTQPFTISKASRKSIEDNHLLAPMLYEVEASISIKRMDQAFNDLKVLNDSVHVDALVDSYGVAADEASLKRSKSAMKGVRDSFAYFKNGFEESILEDLGNGMDGMNRMYLNDMMDHLNLGKACLINDASLMSERYDMDTASRELMSDSLHEYLNSDKFFDEVSVQKKAKKKVKP